MRGRLYLFVPIAAFFVPMSAANAAPITRWVWNCHIDEKLDRGEMWASRTYDDTGKLDAGDFFHWNSKGYDASKRRAPIEWEVGYIWHPVTAEDYDDRRAEIKLDISLEAGTEMPWAGLLQIQRPFPVEPYGVIGSTALTTTIFHGPEYGPKGDGYGSLPLGDLLAYAGSYDELDWMVTKVHDQYGHAAPLASGKLDVAALREASAAIPRLKLQMGRMGSNFRKNCKYEERLLLPIFY